MNLEKKIKKSMEQKIHIKDPKARRKDVDFEFLKASNQGHDTSEIMKNMQEQYSLMMAEPNKYLN